MKFILEYKSFYKEDDIIIIEYWYNAMLTPVKILEKITKTKYRVSHKVEGSQIPNAPDEIIKSSDILDKYKSN